MKIAWELLSGRSGHDAGRTLLEKMCLQAIGRMPEIRITPQGKPFFRDCDLHFSISHTNNHAFCVLADAPVGVDGEELTRRVNPALGEKVLSPGELAQYASAADPNRAFLTFWVLKEAQGKCSGRGLGFHPRHTDFMLTDSRVFECDGCLVAIVC